MILRKFTASVLVFYVLVLLTQPCQDVFARPSDAGDNSGTLVRYEIHADPESEDETCSPFCICSCCSLSVISCEVTFGAVLEADPSPICTLATNYESPYAKTFRASIWQPPKA